MQTLFKPFLFAVARLGLFLAVVAWIVGQWWTVEAFSPYAGGTICRHGCILGASKIMPWRWRRIAVDKQTEFSSKLEDLAFGVMPMNEQNQDFIQQMADLKIEHCLGFSLVRGGPADVRAVCVKHWMIVVVVGSFNIGLKWFYRKRPEAEPCED